MPFNIRNYMDNVAQTPDEAYRGLAQATIISQFDNTTQLRTVQEEGYPFNGEYTEFKAWINTVSDVTTSTNKVIGNYMELMFEDMKHNLNYRGTKYIYENETYLTYDKLNPINVVPTTKIIKCNNYLTFKSEDGTIVKEPVFIGWEITSTNPQISKEGTTENRRLVVLSQNNKYTKDIKVNQRFILNHKRAFKVESIDDMQMENLNTEEVTLNTFYISWDVILPTDDLVNNLADGMNDMYYSVSIPQGNISQVFGYEGQLTAITKYGDTVVDNANVIWTTSDKNVIKVYSDGRYEILGVEGESALITCISTLDNNAKDSILVSVIAQEDDHKKLIIEPMIESISKLRSVKFRAYVQVNGTKTGASVSCVPNWIDNRYYTLELLNNSNNEYVITCVEKSNKPLVLKFEGGGISKEISIKLEGLL